MPTTLSSRPSARPKRAVVRRLPNPPHRPTDLKILGFEIAFEAIVVERDDAHALGSGWKLLQHIGSVQAMVERRSFAMSTISRHDEAVLRECRSALGKLIEHMRARTERLTGVCIPEAARVAHIFDLELSSRKATTS